MPRASEQIKKDVVGQLYCDGRVNAADISVTVNNGIVEISGAVPSRSARTAAVEAARYTPGVTNIIDNIEVRL